MRGGEGGGGPAGKEEEEEEDEGEEGDGGEEGKARTKETNLQTGSGSTGRQHRGGGEAEDAERRIRHFCVSEDFFVWRILATIYLSWQFFYN